MSRFGRMKGADVPMVKRLREIAEKMQKLSVEVQKEADRRIAMLRHAEEAARACGQPLYQTELEIKDDGGA